MMAMVDLAANSDGKPLALADVAGAGSYDAAVFDRRVALDADLRAGIDGRRDAAQRDAVIKRDVVADDGGLADHHAGPVVDDEPAADLRARMDLDGRQNLADVGDEPRQQAGGMPPQPMAQPIEQQRMEARIAQYDLEPAPGRRIAGLERHDILLEPLENHISHNIYGYSLRR